MSDFAIKVEGLGKKFIIGHEKAEKYTALRDVISNNVKGIWKKTRELVSGNYWVEGNEEEEFWALKDLNFTINQGDRVGIIGRNGAGKSTLLKILSRITEPTEGRITIQGRVASLLEVGTGFHPELSGRENIYLNGAILGMSRADIKRKFDEIVDFAEVERFLDTPVKRYSSGMYVRLAFSVAAHLEPDILIVDEVLAVGDAQFQKKCLGKMEDVSKNQGRTVLFVSHNMGVIAQLCQSIILLNGGMIKGIGPSKDLLNEYYLSQNVNESEYNFNKKTQKEKPNYFSKIYTSDINGNRISSFAFNQSIVLNFLFYIGDRNPNIQIGIGLNDKYNNRVFTLLKSIDFFKMGNDFLYSGKVELPSDLIAPNNYSFVFAIWTKDGIIFDLLENICSIKIHDSGTELSLYEGTDHGNIIISPNWKYD